MKIERQREIMDVVNADISGSSFRDANIAGVSGEDMLTAYRASAKGQK